MVKELVNIMENKRVFRLTENDLKNMVSESVKKIVSELDWRTYASAAQKNDEWRKENPKHRANQWNRSFGFRDAARDAFDKKHGLEHQFDEPNSRFGGDKGSINLNSMDDFSVHGSRDHDFGDGDPHGLRHNVYHMSKEYGKDGGYGRTRMWDTAHETTPEKFYGSKEMGQKFRDAEKDAEDFTSGKSHYVKGKGWTNESVIKEAFQNNQGYSHFAVNRATNKIVNGWDYHDEDPDDLRQWKKDYFDVDLIDNDMNPKDYRILTGKYLLRQGIDPDDNNNWANC